LLLHEQAVKIKEQKNQLENELAVYQQQLNEILQIAKQISKERQKLQKFFFIFSFDLPKIFSAFSTNATMLSNQLERKKLIRNK